MAKKINNAKARQNVPYADTPWDQLDDVQTNEKRVALKWNMEIVEEAMEQWAKDAGIKYVEFEDLLQIAGFHKQAKGKGRVQYDLDMAYCFGTCAIDLDDNLVAIRNANVDELCKLADELERWTNHQ